MKIFRKLLIILLLTLTIPTATLFADFRTVDYTITFTDNHGYDLETGLYGYTPNYQVTNRMEIKFNDITLDALNNFNHLLFFDKNNTFIGYYNTTTNDYETSKYLGFVNSFTPEIPAGAKYFAFQSFHPYYNLTPIPEIGNNTLNEVFGVGSYDLFSTFNTLEDSSTYGLDIPITELNNNTLREVFEGGEIVENMWSLVDANGSYNNGIYSFTATAQYGRLYASTLNTYNSIAGNNYYYIAIVKSTTNHQMSFTTISGSSFIRPFQVTNQYAVYMDNYTESVNRTVNRIAIRDDRSSNWTQIDVKYFKILDRTLLGISSLTVSQMDYWFSVYQAISTATPEVITTAQNYTYTNGIYKYYIDNNFPAMFYFNGMPTYWSPIYETTFNNLTTAQMENQYDWFVLNPNYMLDFDDINWYPTDTELENYYTQYNNNLFLDAFYFDTITFTELQTVSPTYTYEYTVDTRDPITKLNDFLDDINLGSSVFKFSISIIITILSMVLLYVFFKPSALVLIIDGILFTILFVFIGWIPNYIIILLGAILFYLLVKNGGSNNEE